jgi:hypothetical protein
MDVSVIVGSHASLLSVSDAGLKTKSVATGFKNNKGGPGDLGADFATVPHQVSDRKGDLHSIQRLFLNARRSCALQRTFF